MILQKWIWTDKRQTHQRVIIMIWEPSHMWSYVYTQHKCYRFTYCKQQKIGTVNVAVEHVDITTMCFASKFSHNFCCLRCVQYTRESQVGFIQVYKYMLFNFFMQYFELIFISIILCVMYSQLWDSRPSVIPLSRCNPVDAMNIMFNFVANMYLIRK